MILKFIKFELISFIYLSSNQGHKGFIEADQAHRGYKVSYEEIGLKSVNPLYMKYTPDSDGNFSG